MYLRILIAADMPLAKFIKDSLALKIRSGKTWVEAFKTFNLDEISDEEAIQKKLSSP